MKTAFGILVGTSLLAGSAMEQSNVTIYGIIDGGIVHESGGPAGSVTKLGSGIESGSRLGFRGREDLGGGMAASFVLENGMNIDTGTAGQGGLLFGRQAFVSLDTNAGSVSFGRQYTPIFGAVTAIDPFFGAGLAGSGNNMLSEHGIRMNNTVKYGLPKGAISGELAYGAGEQPGDSSARRSVGALLGYTQGPLALRVAYQRTNNIPGASVAADSGRTTMVGGTYDFRVFKAHLGFQTNKGLITINGRYIAGTDSRDLLVGATVPVGINTLTASYTRKDDRSGPNRDATQYALGFTHPLSKRTDLYASVARIRNDAAPGTARFYTVGNGSDTAAATRRTTWASGISSESVHSSPA
ncbi:porin [Achromobacter animicus]|uniref:porin n=1 Tax=Achromobacter animicus TaxID=1389935 RepID=UPI00312CBAF6